MIANFITTFMVWLGVPHAQTIAGDLQEERGLVAVEAGRWHAMYWYAWQVSRLMGRAIAVNGAVHGVMILLAIAPLHLAWSVVFDFFCLLPPVGLSQVNAAGVVAGAMFGRRALWLALVPLVWGVEAFPFAMATGLALPAGLLAARIGKEIA